MLDSGINIYSCCRRAAGLTQEEAAELLDCGVGTLARWETDVHRPPDEKVLRMCEIYGTPTLAVEHLRRSSELARYILPQVETRPLAQAVCGVLSAIRSFTAAELDWGLMEIAADGAISPEERRGFDFLMQSLESVVEASYELKLSREAIKKPACTLRHRPGTVKDSEDI